MAKALFLSLPLHGHINPSVPLVRELIERGDEILYYAAPAFAAKIEQTKAHYRPYQNKFLIELNRLPDSLHQLPWLMMRTTAEVLEHELDDFRAERPDYLICDSYAPWGQWVAEALRRPLVTSICTFAFNRRVLDYAFARGVRPKSARLFLSKLKHLAKALALRRRVRQRFDLTGPDLTGLAFGSSGLNIVYTSDYFQPCAETFDDRYLFVGPAIYDRAEQDQFPWERVKRSTVIYISMGTLFNTDDTFYRNCFEAFGDGNFQVIMSIGSNVSPESLGAAPENFIVRPYVPQLEALKRAKAFVTHAGMNSVNESLYHGAPIVAIPQMSEQEIVGRRVEELGAGIYLPKTEATIENLRSSVERLLTEDAFREKAALVQESLTRAGGVARAADEILAFRRKKS